MSDKWVSNSADYTARQPTGASDAWTQEAAARGHTGSQVLREVVEIAPTNLVCHGLAIPADSTVIARRRTVLLDGEPVELADSYYPAVIARGTQLAQSTKIRGGSPTLLAALGHPIKRVREEVSARPPTEFECNLLKIRQDEWVLIQKRVALDQNNNPIEFSIMVIPASQRALHYEIGV
jgi:GntR family transcriptional regulator